MKYNARTWLLICCASCSAILAAYIAISRSFGTENSSQDEIAALPDLVYVPDPLRTDSYNHTWDLLINHLYKQPSWTDEEAWFVASLIEGGYPIGAENSAMVSQEDRDAFSVYDIAVSVASTRLSVDRSLSDTSKRQLRDALCSQLRAASPRARLGAVSAVVQAGLAHDPSVRAKVEVLRNDPDPLVAQNAIRQLAHLDHRQRSRHR